MRMLYLWTCLTTIFAFSDRLGFFTDFSPSLTNFYELPSDGIAINTSDYYLGSNGGYLPRFNRKWYETFDYMKSLKQQKRFRNLRIGKRIRVIKYHRGLSTKRRDKLVSLKSWYNGSEEELLPVVSPYPANVVSLREPSAGNFSELNNGSGVISSESVVTDYDYGFRGNVAVDDVRGNASVGDLSPGFGVSNDVIGDVVPDYRWGFLSLFLLVLMGGLGNVLVCLSICLERRLQNVTNYFLLSLAVADLLVCVAVMPFSIGDAFYGHWPFGWHLCSFWVSCDVLSCSSSILHMCVVSVGRYMGIRNPLKTRSRASGKRSALVKIALVWMASCAIASPIAVLALLDPTNIQPRDDLCAINNRFFFVFGSLFAFYAPMVVMVTSYALTVHLLRKKAQFCQMENVCSSATMVGGGSGEKVSLSPFQVNTCLRCGEKSNVSGGTAGDKSKTQTWKTLLLPKRKKCNAKKISKVNRAGIKAAKISESMFDGQIKDSIKTEVVTGTETEETRLEEATVCQYCGSTILSRSGSSNSKERQRFPSSFLRNRKRCSQRSSSASYDSAIASTSGSNSVSRKISTSSKHENGKTVCRKESIRSKGGQTMFRVLGSTTRAQVHNEQKATKVLGLVFFAFVVCWSPFFVLNILFAVSGPDSLPEYLATTFLWLGYVSSTINPLIYTAFNRTFRRAFWKLLTCGKCGSGFSSAYVGSRMERGFRATTSASSINVKHRIEWGRERVKRSNDTDRIKFGNEKGIKSKELTEVTDKSRYLYRGGSGNEDAKRWRKAKEKTKSVKCNLVVSPDVTTSCDCGLCEFQSDESGEGPSETNFRVKRGGVGGGGGGKRILVKSFSTSCANEIQEEDRFRQDRGCRLQRRDTETRIAISAEDFGSFKNRKLMTGRKRQQLRLTQKEKKSDREQTFC